MILSTNRTLFLQDPRPKTDGSSAIQLGRQPHAVSQIRRRSRSAESSSCRPELLLDMVGKDKIFGHLPYRGASLPLQSPVEQDIFFEVED
jgi:hypothetical protein